MLLQIIFSFVFFVLSVSAGNSCGSYVVDSAGTDLSYSSYIFSDFRNLSNAASSSTSQKTVKNPSYANGNANKKREVSSLQAAQAKGIARVWQVQDWDRPDSPVPMKNTADNVFIDYDPVTKGKGTMLSLTTTRQQDGTQETAEIDSAFQLMYGSIRFSARVTGDAGACAGLFLYADDTHESDFEFLTQEGPDYVHLTNQPGQKNGRAVPGAHTNLTLKAPYDQWHTYRLDWSPGMTRYFIDGNSVVNKTINVSSKPMNWLMNIWSDGTSWPGVMAKGDSARLDIRWLQIAFNKPSDSSNNAANGVTCRLQNEMVGQGLTANFGKASAAGGSLAGRAAATVNPIVADGFME